MLLDKLNEKTGLNQLLPESLKKILDSEQIFYKETRLKKTYLIDIVNCLLLRYYNKGENNFNLSSVILKEKYGHIYNYYINFLLEKGIIQLIKNYSNGKNTRIYKLNENILNDKVDNYVNCDKVLIKKYKNNVRLDKYNFDKNIIDTEIKRKLIQDLFYVEIDRVKSLEFLKNNCTDAITLNKNKYSVDCISNNHIFFHFDSYGRMHTNFTILKSHIRKNYLTIDCEELVEFDIKNSQPLFLTKIIEEEGLDMVELTEYYKFKEIVVSGNFWKHFIEETGLTDKKIIKRVIYKVLFGRNLNTKYDKIFKKLFPSIYSFIKIYKKRMGDYKILSHKLQNLESNMIFNSIVKEIIESNPEIRLITIHDSIMCQKKYSHLVGNIFEKKIKEQFELNNIYEYA